nr:hypothetical protein [Geoalkalibacter sp.]
MLKRIVRVISLLMYRSIGIRLPHSFWPGGRVFSGIRRLLLIGMGCRVGKGCELEPHIDVGFSPNLTIGDRCQINQNITIKTAIIGNDVMIAPGTVFLDRFHNFNRIDIPMAQQGATERQMTVVEDDVWIGQNVIFMPGLKVSRGSVVGSGAVVTKDVIPYAVVAGVPAKIVRYRDGKSDESI